jgi:hypothetical protein
MASNREPYASGAQNVIRPARALGLPVDLFPIAEPEGVNLRNVRTTIRQDIALEAVRKHGEILTIDADDDLLAAPLLIPDSCHIGLWRNPELKLFPTHLQWACGVYLRNGEKAEKFVWFWKHFGQITNDHRALHLAYDFLFNCFDTSNPIQDITAQVSGCIRLNPSPLGYRSSPVVV